MLTIGFTNKYYTLWEVGEAYEDKRYYNGLCIGSTTKQNVVYIRNLSLDFEKAKSKVKGEYEIKLELKSQSSFVRILKSDIKDRENYYPHDCFSFGKTEGEKIEDCEDVWILNRAYTSERSKRRKVCARRKLIQLGELVKYTWYDTEYINVNWGKKDELGNCLPENIQDHSVRNNYMKPSEIDGYNEFNFYNNLEKGHHFNDGEKVELSIKSLKDRSFAFNAYYGTTFVNYYASKCGKLLKYMGSTPPDIKDEYVSVMATIKHDNYEGENETKLMRIKIKK